MGEIVMSDKKMILLGVVFGSFVGGYAPCLVGADSLSITSLFGSAAGGILGLWISYKLTR
jgi:outer membrane lipoprotein SlyB